MTQRFKGGEVQVLATLQSIRAIARSAKRIEEISDAMNNLAFQANAMAMDTLMIAQEANALTRLEGSVNASKDDLYEQFALLMEEVSELHLLMNNKSVLHCTTSKDLN